MLNSIAKCIALLVCPALIVCAQGNTFLKVRYNGGAVATKVAPDDWHNKLTATSDMVTFVLKDGQKIEIQPKSISALSYGQEACRRGEAMIALGILRSPLGPSGLSHKTMVHYIGIEYKTADGKPSALLLQGDKSNYRAILIALHRVNGLPVAVSERERSFIPPGVTIVVSNQTDATPSKPEKTASPAATVSSAARIVKVASEGTVRTARVFIRLVRLVDSWAMSRVY